MKCAACGRGRAFADVVTVGYGVPSDVLAVVVDGDGSPVGWEELSIDVCRDWRQCGDVRMRRWLIGQSGARVRRES